MTAEEHRRHSSRMTESKLMADGIRRMPPVRSPKREGRHEQTTRSTGGVARSQVDPPQGGTGAASIDIVACGIVRRASPPSGPPAALPGGPLDQLPEAAHTGFSAARFVVQPAYPLWPHSVSPPRRLAGGRAPFDPLKGDSAFTSRVPGAET